MVEGVSGGWQPPSCRRYARAAPTGEVTTLRREAREFKEVVAEQILDLRLLKKSMIADEEDIK